MECKSLRASGNDLKSFDIAYFMASVDDAETNRKFAEKNDADFPILSDPDKAAASAYGVLSPAGYASRWTFYIGPEGDIQHIDREVKPLSAGADVVSKLTELEVPRK